MAVIDTIHCQGCRRDLGMGEMRYRRLEPRRGWQDIRKRLSRPVVYHTGPLGGDCEGPFQMRTECVASAS